MKGNLINFVKTANYFLFFFGTVFLLLFIGYQIVDNVFNDRYPTHDSIPVVDGNDTTHTPIEYETSFIEKHDDVYIFRVKSNRILGGKPQVENAFTAVQMFSKGVNDDFETVNYLFARINGEPGVLLDSHALVLDANLINLLPEKHLYHRKFKTFKHLFTVVMNDTNQDKVLDRKDKISLLASDYDGANLITIAEDISNYEIIDDNLLLLSLRETEKSSRFIYNLNSGEKQMLHTELP